MRQRPCTAIFPNSCLSSVFFFLLSLNLKQVYYDHGKSKWLLVGVRIRPARDEILEEKEDNIFTSWVVQPARNVEWGELNCCDYDRRPQAAARNNMSAKFLGTIFSLRIQRRRKSLPRKKPDVFLKMIRFYGFSFSLWASLSMCFYVRIFHL